MEYVYWGNLIGVGIVFTGIYIAFTLYEYSSIHLDEYEGVNWS